MKVHARTLLWTVLLATGCAAEMAADESSMASPEVEAAIAPLYTLEVSPGHSIEFIDLGRGARVIGEHAPEGTALLSELQTRSFSEIFHHVRPNQDIPSVLLEADAVLGIEQRERHEGVGAIAQAASTSQWKSKLGGCACPLGDVVHSFCKQGRTGNFSDTQEAEYAWFNINHISGNGLDAFTICDGKTVKRRYPTGDIARMTCIGPQTFLGLDTDDVSMRLEIKGADGDVMDLSACWSIF